MTPESPSRPLPSLTRASDTDYERDEHEQHREEREMELDRIADEEEKRRWNN